MKAYPIAYGSRLKVKEGDRVVAGDELPEGQINPHDLLRILGQSAVQDYLLKEVLSVYRLQGVAVADKHIEIIVRQMLRKVRVEDNGDTELLPGALVGGMLAWYEVGFSAQFPALFAVNALWVGIGEAVVCYVLGILLLRAIPNVSYLRRYVPEARRSFRRAHSA